MEITSIIGCRVDCYFCPQELIMKEYSLINKIENISYGKPVVMSFETFKMCCDKLPKTLVIAFSGYAENFLNPEITDMILYAHQLGHPIRIFSTLVGMKLEDIDKIKHIPFDSFLIHLPDTEMFAKIPVNSKYLEVLQKLITSKIKNLSCMTMGSTHPKIKEILNIKLDASEMQSRAGNLKNVRNEFEKKLGPLCCNMTSRENLEDVLNGNVLLPNGDVSLCCMDYGLQNILGNLLKCNYNELFDNDSFKKIREKMKSDDSDIICRNCVEAISDNELNQRREIIKNNAVNELAISIIQLYQNLLERFPDKEGFDYFYSKLSNKELTLQELEMEIRQSSEYANECRISLNNISD